MRIAVCVHLYHIDMIDEISYYLNNLQHEYDLYISLTKNYPISFLNNLKKINTKTEIVFVKNVGMDIGGFLQVYRDIRDSYDLILKIHTKKCLGSSTKPSKYLIKHGMDSSIKKGKIWFVELMQGVLGNKQQVDSIINELITNDNCGMVGTMKKKNFSININNMNEVFGWMKVSPNISDHEFIGGTIFWVKNDILKKYLTVEIIDKIIESSPDGYCYEPSINHAMERIFGSLVYMESKKIYTL